MQKSIKIIWDNEAKADLKLIFEFLKLHSLSGAKKVISDIIKQSKSIHFSEQYQTDEFLGEPFRRMFSGNYRIVYKIHTETEIRVLQIFDTRRHPTKLRK